MGRTIRNTNKKDKKRFKQYRQLRRKRGIDSTNPPSNNKNNDK